MMFAADAPTAAMMMPRLPPILSTSGPLTRNDSAYVHVPAAKISPKSRFVMSVPNAFLATFKLYRPMYRNAYVMPSGNQLMKRRIMNQRLWFSGLL